MVPSGVTGLVTLIGIVGGGWLAAAFMFREIFGRFPWQKRDDGCGDPDAMADPESRCPRDPKDCVCWKDQP